MLQITSTSNPRVRKAVQLVRSRGRKQQRRFIVFGGREVCRCLASGMRVEEVFIGNSGLLPSLHAAAEEAGQGPQWLTVSEDVMSALAYGDREVDVVATVQRPELGLEQFHPRSSGLIVVLEGIEKPGNVGAVFRSCDGAGVAGIMLADSQTDLFHPNSIRASMGTVFHVPAAMGDSESVRDWLERQHLRILTTRPDAMRSYDSVTLATGTAIVLGNEAVGLSDRWDGPGVESVSIPMAGIADSLNLSVTAAVIAFEAARQSRGKGECLNRADEPPTVSND